MGGTSPTGPGIQRVIFPGVVINLNPGHRTPDVTIAQNIRNDGCAYCRGNDRPPSGSADSDQCTSGGSGPEDCNAVGLLDQRKA
jgi:hypothetical protein